MKNQAFDLAACFKAGTSATITYIQMLFSSVLFDESYKMSEIVVKKRDIDRFDEPWNQKEYL